MGTSARCCRFPIGDTRVCTPYSRILRPPATLPLFTVSLSLSCPPVSIPATFRRTCHRRRRDGVPSRLSRNPPIRETRPLALDSPEVAVAGAHVPGCRGYIPPASAGSDYEGESRRNVGATTLARDRTRTHTHTHTVRGGTRGVPEERLAPLFTWCDFTSRGNVDAGRPGYFYAERSSAGTGPSEHGERRASGRSFVRPPAMNLLLCYYCFGRAAHAPCTLPLRLPAAAAAAASRRPRPSPRPPARVNKPLTHGSPANR